MREDDRTPRLAACLLIRPRDGGDPVVQKEVELPPDVTTETFEGFVRGRYGPPLAAEMAEHSVLGAFRIGWIFDVPPDLAVPGRPEDFELVVLPLAGEPGDREILVELFTGSPADHDTGEVGDTGDGSATAGHDSGPRALVYGLIEYQHSLAVLPADMAQVLSKELQQIEDARTYGALKRLAPTLRYADLPVALDDDDHPDDEPFDIASCPAVGDGDWPQMATQMTLDWLPVEVWADCGEIVTTVFSGDYLELPPECENVLVERLTKLGYTCRRDDTLITSVDVG